MILVDTSVLIDYERTSDPKLFSLFQSFPVAVCGVTRAEVLHGPRTPAERTTALALLAMFALVPIPEPVWDTVGDNLAALRAGGVTIPFPDAVIATVAIVGGYELWARDHHFTLVQRVLPALTLFAEPP